LSTEKRTACLTVLTCLTRLTSSQRKGYTRKNNNIYSQFAPARERTYLYNVLYPCFFDHVKRVNRVKMDIETDHFMVRTEFEEASSCCGT